MACVKKRRDRWVLDFYDQDGVRRWKTMPEGTKKDDAIDELAKILKKVTHGAYTPVKSIPLFPDVAKSWLDSKEPNIRHSTYQQYKGHVDNHLKPYFEKLKVNQLNFEAIEKFKKHCLDEGVTAPTLRKILVSLGGILRYAVRMRYIDYNAVREVDKPKGKSTHNDKDEMIILSPVDIRKLFDATKEQKSRVLFMAAVFTGLRQGELLGLEWGDIDWTNCQVCVRRTYNHGRFYEPKSKASRRRVDLAPELISELKKWKLACPPGEHDLVFPTEIGTPQSSSNVLRRQFFPALRKANLPKIRFHDLRHTYASLLIDQGEHPKYIQNQLGHSSITMTMDVYGHLMNTVNQKAATKLGRTILGDSEANGSKMVAQQGRAAELWSVSI